MSRRDFIQRAQPLVDAFVRELAGIFERHFAKLRAGVVDRAHAELKAQLAAITAPSKPAPPEICPARPRRKARAATKKSAVRARRVSRVTRTNIPAAQSAPAAAPKPTPRAASASRGPACSRCKRPGHNARTCVADPPSDEEPVAAPASPRETIALRSTVAPCTALAPKRLGEKYSDAELADAHRRIEERRAREPAIAPKPEVVEPAPPPIVAALPVPRCTFEIDTRPRWEFADD